MRTFYQCEVCGHLSGDTYESSRYADYYGSLADDYYTSHEFDKTRYEQILQILPDRTEMRVLDIGCGTGTFLSMLPAQTQRFGIEPAAAAADEARSKGVTIIQDDDLDKPEMQNTFDLVTAIDVVEHTANLLDFRRCLIKALRPGGTLILLTGDAKSPPARFLGRYWSYLNYAEHITVFCSDSMRTWLQTDITSIELARADHHSINGSTLIRMWGLFPLKWLVQKIRPRRVEMHAALALPGDHMLVRATRNQQIDPDVG